MAQRVATLGDASSSAAPATPNCYICYIIINTLHSNLASKESIKIDVRDAITADCEEHKPLISRIVEFSTRANSELPSYASGTNTRAAINIHQERYGSINHVSVCADYSKRLRLLLAPGSPEKEQPGQGRPFDMDWIDLNLLKKWRDHCYASHGEVCKNPMGLQQIKPAWLVDTVDRCVVQGHAADSFMALSYMWGNAPGVYLDSEAMRRLQKTHALDTPELRDRIPPTVRHAIYLASFLGERYIWVDTLCIVHDDAAAATEQLGLMGAIYASAKMTIIAADGCAQDGILGLKGVPGSRPRNGEYGISYQLGAHRVMVVPDYPDLSPELTSKIPYYTRGWTFQEHLLSNRKILFYENQIHWQCWHSKCHEYLVTDVGRSQGFISGLDIGPILMGNPSLIIFNKIIQEYNKLEFKYQEDVSPGIIGLLSLLSRTFRGGFLYGMPEMYFDGALGWMPPLHSYFWDNLKRRVQSNRPDEVKISPCALPSWSWIGWQGKVDLTGQFEEWLGKGYLEFTSPDSSVHRSTRRNGETLPLTKWYTGPSPETPPQLRRRIQSSWYDLQQNWKDNESTSLPSEWTRHELGKSPHAIERDDSDPEIIYTHSKFPAEKIRREQKERFSFERENCFPFPFPLSDLGGQGLPDMPEQTTFLFCKTQLARITMDDGGSLFDSSTNICGFIVLHNEGQQGEVRRPIPLVAINRRRFRTPIPLSNKREPRDIKEFHTVLWVEWDNGVAYRQAAGIVASKAWEKLDRQDIDLVLG